MTKKFNPESPEGQALLIDIQARRDFLKKLGKYAAVTSATTATLLTAQTVSAATINSCAAAAGNSGCKCILGICVGSSCKTGVLNRTCLLD